MLWEISQSQSCSVWMVSKFEIIRGGKWWKEMMLTLFEQYVKEIVRFLKTGMKIWESYGIISILRLHPLQKSLRMFMNAYKWSKKKNRTMIIDPPVWVDKFSNAANPSKTIRSSPPKLDSHESVIIHYSP